MQGPAPLLAAAAVLLLAGCLGAQEDPGAGHAITREDVLLPPWQHQRAPPDGGALAPDLTLGTTFTYRTTGLWDLTDQVTVVVARAGPTGYLFAAGAPEDLRGEIVLERAWFGTRDTELNRVPTNVHPEGFTLFDFPLYDGKTWRRGAHVVTATEAKVATPWGAEDGFRMEVAGTDFSIRYTYAPSVGYLSRYTYTWDDRVLFDLTLEDVGTTDAWVWYEVIGVAEATDGDLSPSGVFHVPSAADAIVVYAGGSAGARGVVTPPPGTSAPWTFEVAGREQGFVSVVLPASQGPWGHARVEPGGGFSVLMMVATEWLHGAV